MRYKFIFKLIISAAFLIFVLYKVDLDEMAGAIASIHIGFYIISLLIVLLNSLILAIKFKILMKPSGIYQNVTTLLRINLSCRFYSFFLTPAVGQGIIRWYTSTKNQSHRGKFITVMILERSTFLFVLCFAVLVFQYTLTSRNAGAIGHVVYPSAIAVMTAMSIIAAYLFSPRVNTTIDHLLAYVEKKFSLLFPGILSTRFNLFDIYLNQTTVLLKSLIVGFIWHLFYLMRVYLLSIAIDVPLDFFQISWMASLVLLLQVIPITLNGIGLRESVYALLFSLEGFPTEMGVLLGLLFFSQMVIVSAIGGVVSFFDRD